MPDWQVGIPARLAAATRFEGQRRGLAAVPAEWPVRRAPEEARVGWPACCVPAGLGCCPAALIAVALGGAATSRRRSRNLLIDKQPQKQSQMTSVHVLNRRQAAGAQGLS